MECWNHGIWIKAFGINFYSAFINVDIDARDNHPFVAIMAFPNPPEADPSWFVYPINRIIVQPDGTRRVPIFHHSIVPFVSEAN
jgi:hypothetical protein